MARLTKPPQKFRARHSLTGGPVNERQAQDLIDDAESVAHVVKETTGRSTSGKPFTYSISRYTLRPGSNNYLEVDAGTPADRKLAEMAGRKLERGA